MGPFIVIEGIDGSGKGTQARLLKERLRAASIDVELTFEPTGGQIGKLIREHMKDPFLDDKTLALLFAADRIEHVQKEVLPSLDRGAVVISDRYVYSSIAYQGQTMDPEWVGSINSNALRPDLVIILDMDTSNVNDRIVDRGTTDCFERDLTFLEGVREMFLSISGGEFLPPSLMTRFVVLDATSDVDLISEQIWTIVNVLLSPKK